MDLHLTGKTALVTGASRGIGLAIARGLAAEGVKVTGAARTIAAELTRTTADAIAVDLSTPTGPAHLVGSVLDRHGDIDIRPWPCELRRIRFGGTDGLRLSRQRSRATGVLDSPDA